MVVTTAAVGTKRTAFGQRRGRGRRARAALECSRLAARPQIAGVAAFTRSTPFIFAENRRNLAQLTRVAVGGTRPSRGFVGGRAAVPVGQEQNFGLTRRAAAIGGGRGLAEHPLEDRVDVLEMIAEVEVFLELGRAQVPAHVLVGREQRQEV